MSTELSQLRYSRVTLAISGSADAADMIEAAGRLARAAGARLHGLLVEDTTLFDLAQLPFSASIASGPLPARKPLTALGLEEAFAKQERILRQLIAATAGSGDLDWTFERRRGGMADIVLSAGEDELLLVCSDVATDEAEIAFASIGSRRESIGGFGILKPRALKTSGPVLAIVGGSPATAQALMLAQKVAVGVERPFEFLLLAKGNDKVAELRDWLKTTAKERVPASPTVVVEGSEDALKSEILRVRPTLIVGDLCSWPFNDPETGDHIIRSSGCPVVLLRCPAR